MTTDFEGLLRILGQGGVDYVLVGVDEALRRWLALG